MKLLIADDEPIIRQGLMTLDWGSIGIEQVLVAKDGLEEIEVITEHKPEIILQDIRMPGLEGLEVVRLLQERGYISQVILLTGFGTFEYAQQAIKLGVFDYLLKPSNPEEILSTVKKAMSKLREETIFSLVKQTSSGLSEVLREEKGKNEPISRMLEHITSSYAKDLSLTSLSDEFHFSPVYISRLIKKETGINFTALVNMIRVVRAGELLNETTLMVGEISEKVGIGNQQYFSQLFKSIYGVTPTGFRKFVGKESEIKLQQYLERERQQTSEEA